MVNLETMQPEELVGVHPQVLHLMGGQEPQRQVAIAEQAEVEQETQVPEETQVVQPQEQGDLVVAALELQD